MKQKFRTTSFWLGLCGAIVIVLESISGVFGINLYSKEIESIILSICSALVMLGIITKKSTKENASLPMVPIPKSPGREEICISTPLARNVHHSFIQQDMSAPRLLYWFALAPISIGYKIILFYKKVNTTLEITRAS